MKVFMFGPDWEERYRSRDGRPVINPSFEADARTLGEAVATYAAEFGATFVPYDGSFPEVPFKPGEAPKYFRYKSRSGSGHLVDIHIKRGGLEICPEQDLSFELMGGDLILIGPLIC